MSSFRLDILFGKNNLNQEEDPLIRKEHFLQDQASLSATQEVKPKPSPNTVSLESPYEMSDDERLRRDEIELFGDEEPYSPIVDF